MFYHHWSFKKSSIVFTKIVEAQFLSWIYGCVQISGDRLAATFGSGHICWCSLQGAEEVPVEDILLASMNKEKYHTASLST